MRPASPLSERFHKKVVVADGCWLWAGYRDRNGYGRMGAGTREDGVILAHRASYIIHIGPIPDGVDVLHACDNPPCVRPDHLVLGSHDDNMKDAGAKSRLPFGERHHTSKLKTSQVIEMRYLANVVGMPVASVSRLYGLKEGTGALICSGRSWKKLTQYLPPHKRSVGRPRKVA